VFVDDVRICLNCAHYLVYGVIKVTNHETKNNPFVSVEEARTICSCEKSKENFYKTIISVLFSKIH